MDESMVKYIEKVVEKIPSSKIDNFHENISIFKFYLKFIFKILSPQLDLL
jgi:hypothetical protein